MMAETESILGGQSGVEVILTRMEGKIDRMGDRMERYERDMGGIRSRLHDLSNELSPIVMLDLPGRIRTADITRADHDARITSLENVEQQRKGAAALARILWAVIGVLGAGGIAAIGAIMHSVGVFK